MHGATHFIQKLEAVVHYLCKCTLLNYFHRFEKHTYEFIHSHQCEHELYVDWVT